MSIKRVELDLRAGEYFVVFETDNPYQPIPTQYMARMDIDPLRSREGHVRLSSGNSRTLVEDPWTPTLALQKRGVPDGPRSLRTAGSPWSSAASSMSSRKTTASSIAGRLDISTDRLGELFGPSTASVSAKETAILAVGDHGEGLGEYLLSGTPHFGHIHFLQSAYLRVPLIVAVPGNRDDGSRRSEPAARSDIAPTLLGLMGWKGKGKTAGRNLLWLPAGASVPVFQETYRPEAERDRFGLLDGRWHLIFSPENSRRRLYDISADLSKPTILGKAGRCGRNEAGSGPEAGRVRPGRPRRQEGRADRFEGRGNAHIAWIHRKYASLRSLTSLPESL
jgi:hypothetical protein